MTLPRLPPAVSWRRGSVAAGRDGRHPDLGQRVPLPASGGAHPAGGAERAEAAHVPWIKGDMCMYTAYGIHNVLHVPHVPAWS